MSLLERHHGFFPDPTSLPPPLAAAEVRLKALDLVVQWDRCGQTADYLAAYIAQAFQDRERARLILSTVANELVENAAKFSGRPDALVEIAVCHRGHLVEVVARNSTEVRHARNLGDLLELLTQQSPEALFQQRLRQVPRNGGLGLIILAKDYARLGAEFGALDDHELIPLTMCAILDTVLLEQS